MKAITVRAAPSNLAAYHASWLDKWLAAVQ
jgi:hypothetical protein